MVNIGKLKAFYAFKLHNVEDNVIEFALDILDVMWCNPMNQTHKTSLFLNLYRLLTMLLIVLGIMNLFYLTDVGRLGHQVAGLVFLTQVINDHIFVLLVGNNKILKLLKKRKYFWKSATIDSSNESGTKEIIRSALVHLNLLGVAVSVFSTIHCTYSMYKHMLMFECWIPERFYKFMITVQIAFIVPTAFYVLGLNSLFIGFCAHLTVQFRLVSHKLKSAGRAVLNSDQDTKTLTEELAVIIQHHIFLLNYSQDLAEVLSLNFLIRILQTIVILAAGIYFLSLRNNTTAYLLGVEVITTVMFLFSICCVYAQILTTESMSVSYAAYSSNWYFVPQLAPYVKMIMIRTNRPVKFTAGGIISVNIATITEVWKKSYSYFTALRTMEV